MTLIELSATEAIQKIRDGEITSEELVQACLDRIEQADGEIEAWAYLKPDYALDQARMLDAQRQAGGPVGPLHGIPVGIKDIFDTDALPTENGTALDSGRQPLNNCRVVTLLEEAGAVIMGKTVTTELAVYGPGKTAEEVALVVAELLTGGSGPVVLTRAEKVQVEAALAVDDSGTVSGRTVVWRRAEPRSERILVVTAGTADAPVADECATVLWAHGIQPDRLADVGVARIKLRFGLIGAARLYAFSFQRT